MNAECKERKPFFVPEPLDRLREFFMFCDLLEEHPFFQAHSKAGTFNLECSLPSSGDDTAENNFDEIHLESFLTRLRQFLFKNELFYVKDLRRAVDATFDIDPIFTEFYDKLMTSINNPFPTMGVQVFKSNGQDLVTGFTIRELIEAKLYTGAIHSQKRLDPAAPDAMTGLVNSHIAVSRFLSFTLASSGIGISRSIFAFRNQILRIARIGNKTDLFSELLAYHKRSRSEGY